MFGADVPARHGHLIILHEEAIRRQDLDPSRRSIPTVAKDLAKRALTGAVENIALQGPVVYGRAAEMGRQNGKGALGNLGAATSFDSDASPEERVNAAFFWGAAMLGAGVKGYEHVGRMIESGRIPKSVHPVVVKTVHRLLNGLKTVEGAPDPHASLNQTLKSALAEIALPKGETPESVAPILGKIRAAPIDVPGSFVGSAAEDRATIGWRPKLKRGRPREENDDHGV